MRGELERRDQDYDTLVRKLEFEQCRFFTIVNQMPAAIAVIEADTHKILVANSHVAKIWAMQKPVESYGAEDFKMFISGSLVPTDENRIWTGLKTGEFIHKKEVEVQRFDGTRDLLQTTISPIRDRWGRLLPRP